MATPLDDYKRIVDGLVERRECVTAKWVTEQKPWPDQPENEGINAFIASLNETQRKTLAHLLQDARDGGIHDFFAFLNEQIDLEGLCLCKNGREIPHEPFGTEMHYDWTCRSHGDPWPDPENGS